MVSNWYCGEILNISFQLTTHTRALLTKRLIHHKYLAPIAVQPYALDIIGILVIGILRVSMFYHNLPILCVKIAFFIDIGTE